MKKRAYIVFLCLFTITPAVFGNNVERTGVRRSQTALGQSDCAVRRARQVPGDLNEESRPNRRNGSGVTLSASASD